MELLPIISLIIQIAMGIIMLLAGILIKHILAQLTLMQEKYDELGKTIYKEYVPREELEKFKEQTRQDRHRIKESVVAIMVKLGLWVQEKEE